MWDVIQNRRVCFGAGTLREAPAILQAMTDQCVLVLAFSEKAACVRQALKALQAAGVDCVVDASLRGEPETTDVNRIAAKARGCGAVMAIGGGSVLDTGKAVAMLASNGGCVEEYQMQGRSIDKPCLPLLAVPTTAGTGSEATKVSVVFNPANRLKKSFYSPLMIADAVLLDPELTVSLPREVTVSTGVDALSHAVESYLSPNATQYTRLFSRETMRLVLDNLSRCLERPDDLEARGNMLLASYFGGVALNAGIGLAHMIAQPLGGLLKIPHGVACAVYLPYAMAYNLPVATHELCGIARILGGAGEDGASLAQEGVTRMRQYLSLIGAPDSIAAYVPADFSLDAAVETVSGATGHIRSNPRPVTPEALRSVIERSMR